MKIIERIRSNDIIRLKIRKIRSSIRNIKYRFKHVDNTNDVQKPYYISRDLLMGKYGYIGKGSWICPNVVIGNYVLIAPECAILGGDHNFSIPGKPIFFSGRPEVQKTIIEDDVWVGYRSIINSGVTIGRGSIIAAGSVVTKDVEPYSIVGGIPARKLKMRFIKEEQEVHDIMLSCTPRPGKFPNPK